MATGAIELFVGVYSVMVGLFFFVACELYRRWILRRIGNEIDRKVKESVRLL